MIVPFNEETFSAPITQSLLDFCSSYRYFCVYNSNEKADQYTIIAAFGNMAEISSLHELDKTGGWKFGFCSYDLKNSFEHLKSANRNEIPVQEVCFFVPEVVVTLKDEQLIILASDATEEASVLERLKNGKKKREGNSTVKGLRQMTSKENYLNAIKEIKSKISAGDIYEMNYCMDFVAADVSIDPAEVYLRLNEISRAPFSAYCRFNNIYLMCSSPERFIRKNGETLLTQPVKGTAPRSKDPQRDSEVAASLQNDPKERNENVMIVDVARNDLSRIAKPGTVNVDELFGIYPFQQVHQMISTVSCKVDKYIDAETLLRAVFPPASMTGAPKIKAMQIIEETETFARGIYSGILGYITPDNDMDFNVVIRSIVYNSDTRRLFYSVGSAITDLCEPEKEYEECLLKAKAMQTILQG